MFDFHTFMSGFASIFVQFDDTTGNDIVFFLYSESNQACFYV